LLAGVGVMTILSVSLKGMDDVEEMTPAQLFGYLIAQQIGLDDLNFTDEEKTEFLEGFNISLKEGSMEVIEDKLPELQQFIMERTQAAQAEQLAASRELEATFFQDLKENADVQMDPSGFYYEIIEQGEGAVPTTSDQVRVHYQGELVDGTVFDSSYARGEPVTFPMEGVIPGFSGGLSKIGTGGKIRIFIPAELAYGDNPPPQSQIPPGATLIFEAELLGIE